MKPFFKPHSGGVVPVLCLITSIILSFALAGPSGRSVFISAVDSILPYSPRFDEAPSPSPSPYAESERILELFGVETVFGENVRRSFGGYDLKPETDTELILSALDTVRTTLAVFPDGFFRKLAEKGKLPIRIELCGEIVNRFPLFGLAGTADGARVIALSISNENAPVGATLVHELCHVIDLTLDSLAGNDPSCWNADDWLLLCPPGFSYYGGYCDPDGEPYSLVGDPSFTAEDAGGAGIWFINRSSKISPYEDRAEIFEALFLLGPDSHIMKSPQIAAKLEYCERAARYYLGIAYVIGAYEKGTA